MHAKMDLKLYEFHTHQNVLPSFGSIEEGSSNKPTAKKQKVQTSPKVSASPSIFFKFLSHAKLWASVSKRTLVSERPLHSKNFERYEIVELLGETHLLDTVSKMPPFVP